MAYQRAVEADPPAVVADWDSEPLRRLAALCQELQRGRGNGRAFYLDSRTAGRLFGVPHSQAWKWLRMLCDEGILELVAPGSRLERKANEYRYLPED